MRSHSKVNKFSCYLIGEDSLADHCIKIILESGHALLGICSPSKQINDFANQNAIPYTNSLEVFDSWLRAKKCDFLFSIVNSRILSKELIKLPRHFSINYHNAALPKYAGVHATSWAILNNEQSHGVTWHIIEEGIDTGDILKQAIFKVTTQETNFTLDIKCIKKAIPLFKELLKGLASGNYKRIKQNFNQRSYYNLYQKPKHCGVISWTSTANEIYTLYRALNFSGYANKLCLPKFVFNGTVFFAKKASILNNEKKLSPGTIIELSDSYLRVATATDDIALSQLTDISGKSYTAFELANSYGFKEKKSLSSLNQNFLQQLEQDSEQLAKSESFWVRKLEQIKSLGFWTLGSNETVIRKKVNSRKIIYANKSFKNKVSPLLPANIDATDALITIFILYLYRLNNYDDFSVGYKYKHLEEPESDMRIFFADIVPMNFSFTPDIDFQQAVVKVADLLKLTNKHKTFAKDVVLRYPQLTEQPIAFPIVISTAEPLNEINDYLCFVINEENITLYLPDNLDATNRKIIDNMSGHLQVIIEEFFLNKNTSIESLPILTAEEKQLILKCWNNTKTSYPKNKSISEIFEQQVAAHPNNVAIKFNDISVTYNELNQKVKILSEHLSSLGVTNKSLVAIYFDRGINAILSILSIIKIGAAYVPIDTTYSEQYVKDILNDTKAAMVLTQERNKKPLEKILLNEKFALVNGFANDLLIYKNDVNDRANITIPDNIAYVMYTSGSTGKPKGVMIDHRGIIRLVKNTNYIEFTSSHRVAHVASLSFDAATFEIWGVLLNGATLVCADVDTVLNVEKFDRFLQEEKIDVMWLTSALFNQHAIANPSMFRDLKYLLVGGEALNPDIIHSVANHTNGKPEHFYNGYGPTENTTFTTMFSIQKDFDINKAVPIGRPIANTTTYVLDKKLNLMSVGIPGELFTGGDGLSPGYLNKNGLTKEKFIDLVISDTSEKLYKTGDIVRWLPSGDLDFIGRVDNQVKIRGFRIELEAIELCLLECDAISQCVVITKKEKEAQKAIIAYIVLSDKSRHILDIKNFLTDKLPSYMIPSIFVVMENLPLNQNGKIDKKLLPTDIKGRIVHSEDYVLPKTELENKISNIWKKLLNLDEISVNDDFFYLGGNSLLITEMMAVIEKTIKIYFPFHEFLEEPTIRNLVKLVETPNNNTEAKPDQSFIRSGLLGENIKPVSPHCHSLPQKPSSILLTGATGFLGAHLLNDLCCFSEARIYCLIRANNSKEAVERLNVILKKYALNEAINSKKVNVIVGDIAKPLLGLDQKTFDKLSTDVDSIYHCAAHVHHIYNYKKLYSANVFSTLELLKLATNKKDKHIHYISTLATAKNYLDSNNYIIEDFLDIDKINLQSPDSGYTQTKSLSELLLSQANSRGIKVSIYRPSWITGHSKTGVFAPDNNHLFLLLKGCIQMGYIPKLSATFNFVPVDFISRLIAQISLNTEKIVSKVFNLANPFTLELDELIDYMIAYGYKVKKVSSEEWRLQLPKIDKNNALYPLVSMYAADGGIGWANTQNQFSRVNTDNTNTAIKVLKVRHMRVDYKIFKRYFEFLEKSGFMPKTNIISNRSSMDINEIKMNLGKIVSFLPGNFYWKDRHGYYLGCNRGALDLFGLKNEKDIIGKTDYDLWPEQAEAIRVNDNHVMETGRRMGFEETICVNGAKQIFFTVIKMPLRDENDNIIGVIGNSLDITYRKKLENEKLVIGYNSQNKRIDNYLKEIASCMPGNFYWKDKQGHYLGYNRGLFDTLGFKSEKDIIGKTDYDLWPEQADEIRNNDQIVMKSNEPIHLEETVTMKGHDPMFFAVVKVPLKDADGDVIGIIGNSLDITYRKNAERLELETELQKTKIQEQENFATVASQVSHDIRSPLASLEMILASCKDIPEAKRIALRNATKSATAIADNLLCRYRRYESEKDTEAKELRSILVSLALEEILSLKKSQYNNSLIKFNSCFEPTSSFVFIKADPSNFNRMISNLINNAVDAFEGKEGEIDLKLNLDDERVNIIIQDNGKGMPQEIIDKIMNNIAVTAGKKNGNGIGLAQVRNTLHISKGKMSIESEIGVGTKIILTFPKIGSPDWIAEEIVLHKGDTVVVLDDDDSIHDAWSARFEDYAGIIHLEHFETGEKAIDFINNASEKNKIFLLSDFELINQGLNGLQVIEKTSMQTQSVLVTSHYHNQPVCDLAAKIVVKILPKQLAPEVPIKIEEKERSESAVDNFKKIDLVIIDDDQLLADSLASLLKKRFEGVETYYHPSHFLKNLSQYTKDTLICMDHDFKAQIDGIELAKQLNEAGYTKLYLLSGKTFEEGEVPNYLTVLLKGDTESLNKLV